MRYDDTFSIFGITVRFSMCVAALVIIVLLWIVFIDSNGFVFILIPPFLLFFFLPAICNFISSPFQRGRSYIASFTGGGLLGKGYYSTRGPWPFFRLLLYEDGIEIRAFFQRFYIPYDQMEDFPDKIGFFERGFLIKSDLPLVPQEIRFYGLPVKKVFESVKKSRKRYEDAL